MLFCPTCGNMLLLAAEGRVAFFCQTCPYVFAVNRKMKKTTELERKQVDDVLGGDDAWKNVDQTQGV